ncbi:MAG: TonB-dependent receptor, partial [Gemmatimonadaceae bacterium]
TAAVGRIALRAEGSIRGASDIRTPRGELENTNARTYNVAAGAAYVGDWGHAGGSYRYYDSDYGIPGGFVGGHPRGVDIVMRRHMGRLEGELHPAQGGVLERVRLSAAYTDYRHRELERSGAVGTAFDQELAALDVQARHGVLGPFSLGAFGARAQYRDVITGGTLRTPSTYDYTFAGYAVEELGRGAFRVQLGARYDWARYVPRDLTASIRVGGRRVPVRPRTFGSASGSIGALYAVAEGVRVGASVSRAYRTPDFNELYSDGPHLAAGSFDVGDPELNEETGLGVDVFVRVATRDLRGEVAAFRNRLDDYIYPSSRGRVEVGTSGGRPRLQFTNSDALFTGAEGDLEWSVTHALVVEGTVSYVRAKFVSPGDSIPLFEGTDTTFIAASRYPPLIPPLRGHLGVRFERPRWFAGIGARWADRQDRIGDFERPTAGYLVGEVSGGLRLLAGSRLHTVTLRVDNVTDTEYREHLSRTKEIMPEPGRGVSLLYRLTF